MLDDRLLYELALLDEYKNNHKYLRRYKIINDDVLKIEFTLNVKKYNYSFIAIFNRFFPYQPIEILAITKFYTPHKYLNGAMCLKYGPDNWQTSIRLIDLIDNLYELLNVENPLGKLHGRSPSGDEFTFGQLARRSGEFFMILPIHPSDFKEKNGTLKISQINSTQYSLFVRSINGIEYCHNDENETEFQYYISDVDYRLLDANQIRKELSIDNGKSVLILYLDGHFSLLFKEDDKNNYFEYIVGDYNVDKRSGLDKSTFNKKITIIGLGSVGSRVAVDLARAGYNNFYFVDDDIFMPCNIIRHELNYKYFGYYKVEAIKTYIANYINDKAVIEISKLAMTGQESSSSTNTFLNCCANSSIIIDCTGNDSVLFLLNKVTKDNDIPVISGTVIPGGLGNVILYKKPKDKDLESILASYYQWKNDKTIFGERVNDYSSTVNNQPYIATMSDCSVLCGLIGKLAIKTLHDEMDFMDNITIFSLSDYGDLLQTFHTYKISANEIIRQRFDFDNLLLEKGKEIYENYCSEKDNKQNN